MTEIARFIALNLVVLASLSGSSDTALSLPGGTSVPVLVELFTSEGCSSCPPADALLQKLVATQPIEGATVVGLGQHVDYWDHLGWKDRFSSASFTARQQQYGRVFNDEAIYTPQVVVDGRAELVGSDESGLRRAIGKAARLAHGTVAIARLPSAPDRASARVTATNLPELVHNERADIVLALTEDRLQSDVSRGENRGLKLAHGAVTRAIATIGEAIGPSASAHGEIALAPDWQSANLNLVAFVQARGSRRVIAAASVPLQDTRR